MDVNAFATSLRDLDSSVLLDRFGSELRRDHRASAGLLCYIAEIDRRKLWAEHAYSSMFQFCVEGFHMSEPMTAKRIHAARAMQRFPLVGEMIAEGELHLTAVHLLAPHLTEANHRDVLARARHGSVRETKKLIAEISPKPDVPSKVTTLPRRKPAEPEKTDAPPANGSLFEQPRGEMAEQPTPAAQEAKRRPSRVEPLSPRRYKLEMTVGETEHDRLEEAKALLGHRVPTGDPAVIFSMALDLLLDKLRKERTGETSRPRAGGKQRTGNGRSHHVPAEVKRAVWKRDGARCAYVSPAGRRCAETRWLELHHRQPYARGGEHTVDGIELRCRPHNQHQADLDFGKSFMDRKRRASRAREQHAPYRRCA